jgi:alcohol dehydrogenase, propanol-preferring
MRALQLTAWKSPPELREVPDPEPGPGQVVVRIAAAGACHSDLHLMHDFDASLIPYALPFTLGHENAGFVEAVGAGVDHLAPGEPVAVYGSWGCGRCRRCHLGAENYCDRAAQLDGAGGGLGFDGGIAPLMLVPQARWLVPLGDLDPVEAAPLTDAGLTPYHAIKRSLHVLHGGATAVVIGAGGLGHLAIQILKATSAATVVAVDTKPEALALAAALGADHVVASDDAAASAIRDITRSQGADLALDFVGVDSTIALAAQVSRPLAHVTVVGIGGGTFGFGFFSLPYEASLATTYWGTLPELSEVLDLARRGLVKAHVQRFGLDAAGDAYDALGAGELEGRAVIVP